MENELSKEENSETNEDDIFALREELSLLREALQRIKRIAESRLKGEYFE